MRHAQSTLKNEGFEKEELFDQLTYDLAKSYEAEMIKKDLSPSEQGGDMVNPHPHDLNHKT